MNISVALILRVLSIMKAVSSKQYLIEWQIMDSICHGDNLSTVSECLIMGTSIALSDMAN